MATYMYAGEAAANFDYVFMRHMRFPAVQENLFYFLIFKFSKIEKQF